MPNSNGTVIETNRDLNLDSVIHHDFSNGLLIPDPDLDLDVTSYLDEWGHVRLANVRGALDFDTDRGVKTNTLLYENWVNDHEWIELLRTEETYRKDPWYWKIDKQWICVKAAKRGNDIANRILARKMSALRKQIEWIDPDPDDCHTNMLFVTLTWDTKICGRSEAWENIGSEWNTFLTSLKYFYGGTVKFLRSWESSKKGYPHIHALIYFPNWKFPFIPHGDGSYRIPLELKDNIDKLWHSFVDVIAVRKKDIRVRLKDLMSYIIKFDDRHVPFEQWNEKEKLTMAATWFFGLQQYGNSSEWNVDLTRTVRVIQTDTLQTDLYGDVISSVSYEFVGIIAGSDCKLGGDTWKKTWDKEPSWWHLAWIPKRMSSTRSQLRDMGFA